MNNKIKLGALLICVALGFVIIILSSMFSEKIVEIKKLTKLVEEQKVEINNKEKLLELVKERKTEVKYIYKDGSSKIITKYSKDTSTSKDSDTSVIANTKKKEETKEENKTVVNPKKVTVEVGALFKVISLTDRLYYLHLSKNIIGSWGVGAQVQSNFINTTYVGIGIKKEL